MCKKFLIILLTSIVISGCGFKVVKKTDLGSFDFTTINSTGDKRINYKIKNKILSYSKKNAEKLISINLDTVKTKTIKEKNIKNEITKYQIQIDVSLNFEEINTNKSGEINIKKTGDYSVAKQYSQTLNNEKKLIDVLQSSIIDEITIKLARGLNDL
tara:strand:- start:352 stop:822 length:471 start_codon:yes stop_codon:yes gene_type:complete